ncbi:MAG: MerR family transcriptional regulator [Chloroflexota bacterium]|nr:MerR family transcriptional regulator [Chloroflexota bacterium]
MAQRYRVGEVAQLTNVSIRTLHHYDRIGLLQPASHSEAGYRFYGREEVLRLQQILTLRYLGFPLNQIGRLLDRADFDLLGSLRIQRGVLRDRIVELERVDAALAALIAHRERHAAWDWNLIVTASHAVQHGQLEGERLMERYYTPQQMQQFHELGEQVGQAEIKAIETAWTELMAEVRANSHLDPASPEARALADRWDALYERTMAPYEAYPDLKAAIGTKYEEGVFAGHDHAPQAAEFDFIERVKAARDSDLPSG